MDVRILGIVTCLLLLVSACGGTSESREMTTTVAPTTTEASIIESTDLEELTERLENLAKENELTAFRHKDFWHPMDTLRDKNHLEKLWNSQNTPWKIW